MGVERQWGEFTILESLGRGAYSQVFGVRRDAQDFALKRLHPHLIYDADALGALEAEAEVLSRLEEDHFPKFFEMGHHEEEPYLLMEWIRGRHLGDLVEHIGAGNLDPPLGDRVKLVREIAQGLGYLHGISTPDSQGWIHGDLKARNVMVTVAGAIKIIDLGLSSGTFRYQSLKQLHEKSLEPGSDLFALGNILYELIHGKKLFPAGHEVELYMQMREFRARPEDFSTELPAPIRKVLVRSLNQQATDKYQRVSEVLADLAGFTLPENYGPWLQEFTHESR